MAMEKGCIKQGKKKGYTIVTSKEMVVAATKSSFETLII